MEAIKKKMANLREKLEAAEERSKKAEDDLTITNHKAEEVAIDIFKVETVQFSNVL